MIYITQYRQIGADSRLLPLRLLVGSDGWFIYETRPGKIGQEALSLFMRRICDGAEWSQNAAAPIAEGGRHEHWQVSSLSTACHRLVARALAAGAVRAPHEEMIAAWAMKMQEPQNKDAYLQKILAQAALIEAMRAAWPKKHPMGEAILELHANIPRTP